MPKLRPLTEFQRVGWLVGSTVACVVFGILIWDAGAFAGDTPEVAVVVFLISCALICLAFRIFIQDKDVDYLRRLFGDDR